MVRLRGRAPRGQRLNEKVAPHWQTMTFIGALRSDRIDAPCMLDQPVNRRSFLQYVRQFLVATLGKGKAALAGEPAARGTVAKAVPTRQCR